MTLRRCVVKKEDNLACLVFELSALDLFPCTCHNYICNLFLNGILAGAAVSYGPFF